MWIFLKDAFFSIVEDFNDSDQLLVRARLEGDIERHWPDAEVLELNGADYRFRAFLAREEVAPVMQAMIDQIQYPDFKPQVDPLDELRKTAYYDVWGVMKSAQSKQRYRGANHVSRVIAGDGELQAALAEGEKAVGFDETQGGDRQPGEAYDDAT